MLIPSGMHPSELALLSGPGWGADTALAPVLLVLLAGRTRRARSAPATRTRPLGGRLWAPLGPKGDCLKPTQ